MRDLVHAHSKGAAMSVIRAHDILPRNTEPAPDFKGLRRIMAAFITAMVLCVAIWTALMIRDARIDRTARPVAHLQCTCTGRCLR